MRAYEFTTIQCIDEGIGDKLKQGALSLAVAALPLIMPMSSATAAEIEPTVQSKQLQQNNLREVISGSQKIAEIVNNMRQLGYTRSSAIKKINSLYKNNLEIEKLTLSIADIIYNKPVGFWTKNELNNIIEVGLTNGYQWQINQDKKKKMQPAPPVAAPSAVELTPEKPKSIEWVLDPETGAYKKKEQTDGGNWEYYDPNSNKWDKK